MLCEVLQILNLFSLLFITTKHFWKENGEGNYEILNIKPVNCEVSRDSDSCLRYQALWRGALISINWPVENRFNLISCRRKKKGKQVSFSEGNKSNQTLELRKEIQVHNPLATIPKSKNFWKPKVSVIHFVAKLDLNLIGSKIWPELTGDYL